MTREKELGRPLLPRADRDLKARRRSRDPLFPEMLLFVMAHDSRAPLSGLFDVRQMGHGARGLLNVARDQKTKPQRFPVGLVSGLLAHPRSGPSRWRQRPSVHLPRKLSCSVLQRIVAALMKIKYDLRHDEAQLHPQALSARKRLPAGASS